MQKMTIWSKEQSIDIMNVREPSFTFYSMFQQSLTREVWQGKGNREVTIEEWKVDHLWLKNETGTMVHFSYMTGC